LRSLGSWFVLAGLAAGCLGLFAGSSSALAKGITGKAAKPYFQKMVDCPISQSVYCAYAETLSGEFVIGSKTTPIEHPIVLQGGLADEGVFGNDNEALIPPLYGAEEASKTPQTIPGGLTGESEELGGPLTATAELAGTVILNEQRLIDGGGPGVILPLKVHLQNELLGENCYIGSDEHPLLLHLTDKKTEPPAGTEPIEGEEGKIVAIDKGEILELEGNELVDNSFEAPAATGCGVNPLTELVTTELVNADVGLPSAPGKSKAILKGNTFLGESVYVLKEDKKEIKAKEKAAKPAK
jgi:hypothetical protein